MEIQLTIHLNDSQIRDVNKKNPKQQHEKDPQLQNSNKPKLRAPHGTTTFPSPQEIYLAISCPKPHHQ